MINSRCLSEIFSFKSISNSRFKFGVMEEQEVLLIDQLLIDQFSISLIDQLLVDQVSINLID